MKKYFLLSFISLFTFSQVLSAAEEVIGTTRQQSLNMVIYNNNRALVKDIRSVPLVLGKNEIAFSGISNEIIPTSVLLTGKNIHFLENNFNYDILSYDALLQKSVGQMVTAEYMNPKTGIIDTNQAELLAVNGDTPVLRINGKIDSSYPGRILFNTIPPNLRSKPTLVMSVLSDVAMEQDLTLNYLATGLSWDASYVAEINKNGNTVNLNGWVSLTNHSNTDFYNTKLQVVAGDINLIEDRIQPMPTMDRMVKSMSSFNMAHAENIGDYHIYTLPRETDILSQQTKQVSLLNAENVNIIKSYEFYNNLMRSNAIDRKNIKPNIKIQFDNKSENNLGIALPRGIVRLYQADSAGNMIFVGEDQINHVGNMETVTLNMGDAFDISADVKQTTNREISPVLIEKSFEITLRNGSKNPVNITIKEDFFGTVSLIQSNIEPSEKTTNQCIWKINVLPETTTNLTVTLQEKLRERKGN